MHGSSQPDDFCGAFAAQYRAVPECHGSRLVGHGWYRRYLDSERSAVRCLRCGRCGVSHALLPEDLCAYRDATFAAVESALEVVRDFL